MRKEPLFKIKADPNGTCKTIRKGFKIIVRRKKGFFSPLKTSTFASSARRRIRNTTYFSLPNQKEKKISISFETIRIFSSSCNFYRASIRYFPFTSYTLSCLSLDLTHNCKVLIKSKPFFHPFLLRLTCDERWMDACGNRFQSM